MKKNKLYFIIFLLWGSFFLYGCTEKEETENPIFMEALKQIQMEQEIIDDINFPTEIEVNGEKVYCSFNSSEDVISSDGEIYPYKDEDVTTTICCILQYNQEQVTKELGSFTVLSMEHICDKAMNSVQIPAKIQENISLPTQYGKVRLKWNSSNTQVLSKTGECAYVEKSVNVTLSCSFILKTSDDSYQTQKEYSVVVDTWTAKARFDYALSKINIASEIVSDIQLPTSFDYGVSAKWESDDKETITNVGNVTRQAQDKTVCLALTLSCTNSSEVYKAKYEVKVLKNVVVEGEMNFNRHILVSRARDYKKEQMNNVHYDETQKRIVLDNGATLGTYDSEIINTLNFKRIVGSFSCITSTTATCELAYSIKVNGVWSKYFSYGQYGLGRNNLYYNQTDTNCYMDTDMIEPNKGLVGTALKFRVTLRRTKATDASPALSLVGTAFTIENYSYSVDTSELPNSVDWNVPKLYQHDVPSIGNVICSATTTTMLLKFAGYSFTDKGYDYEHHYMADMVADKGHNNPTYGNWSYNMMTAGAFGINAYVGKYYSWDEIRYHLANYGPLGISISGNFGIYSTGGHLLVLRGYRIENGQTTVICNDPNVKGVYYEVTLDILLRTMGSVVYIMEFNNKEIINFK